jgi:hypothetical protein
MNQAGFLRTWKGLNSEYVGRPGINVTIPQHKKLADYLKLEDERFRYMHEALNKFKEIDDERQILDATSVKVGKDGTTSAVQSATKEV